MRDDEIMVSREEADHLMQGAVWGIIGGTICWAVIFWLIWLFH